MKEKAVTFFTLCSVLFLATAVINFQPARAQNVQNFRINSFHAEYELVSDEIKRSLLTVNETITATFPDFDQNHGILRAIPKSYQDHTISLNVSSITGLNAEPIPYTSYEENGNEVLRIGNPDQFVRGKQTYNIAYDMKNVTGFSDTGEEFYWDINGDQWPQAMDEVSVDLYLSPDVALNLKSELNCYMGSYGNNQSCPIKSKENSDGSKVITATAENVGPYQTMTIVTGFGQGTFLPGPEIAREKLMRKVIIALIAASVALPPLAALIFLAHRWRKYGRDPKGRGVIIPEYQPPKELNVMSSDFILQEGLEPKAVSAMIIELAVRKYITIYETKKKSLLKTSVNYELELVKDPANLDEREKDVINMLFSSPAVGARTDLNSLKNKLSSDVATLGKKLNSDMTSAGYFKQNPKKVKNRYLAWGGGLLIVGFLVMVTVFLIGLGIGLILAALITFAFAGAMPAKSSSGVAVRDHLLGLKDYIKMAEEDRIKFLQSPEGAEKLRNSDYDPKDPKYQVKLFESLLPYAMLFGLEKDWAKQFADIYKQPPEWFHGNVTSFNVGYLAGSLGSMSAAASSSFTPPSSSGSSGMGGGGFSGGGGGGGGGGGW